jgi:hypothetical protein
MSDIFESHLKASVVALFQVCKMAGIIDEEDEKNFAEYMKGDHGTAEQLHTFGCVPDSENGQK